MAQETVGLELKIDALNSAQTLKDLKTGVKDLTNEMLKVDEGSAEFQRLSKAIGNAKERVKDLKEATQLFTKGGTVSAIGEVGQSIAGGFAAAQGAMALFGAESENVQKSLLKVQASLALVEGAKAAIKGLEAAQRLWNAAMAANPIGAIVVAMTALVALVAAYMVNLNGVTDEQKELTKAAEDNVTAEKKKYEALLLSENSLKLQGKSEKYILDLKIAQTEEEINAQLKRLEFAQANEATQVKAAERNREILAGVINWLTVPLTILQKTFNQIAKLVGSDLRIDIGDSLASQLFNGEDVKKKSEAEQVEIQKAIDTLKAQRDGFKLSIQNIDKAANVKALKEQEDYEKLSADIDKKARAAEMQRATEDINAMIAFDEESAKLEAEFEKKRLAQVKADNIAYAEEDLAQLEQKKAIEEAKYAVASAGINSLQSLAVIFGNNGKAQIELQKKLALVQIGVDTAKAISGAVAQGQSLPFPGNLVAVATGVATVLANIAKAKQMLSQAGAGSVALPSVGGGGGATPPPVNNVGIGVASYGTNQQGDLTGQVKTQVVKAYVVESEMTNSQKNVASIIKKSKVE